MNFFVILLYYLIFKIRNMKFVETDEYKNNSKKYLTVFIGISIIFSILIFILRFTYQEKTASHIIIILSFIIYLFLTGLIGYSAFRNILINERGKITPFNFYRYYTVLGSGIAAIILIVVEISISFFTNKEILIKTGSYYMYGISLLSLGLSLNLIFEYLEVLTRANEANKKLLDLNKQMMYEVRTAQSLQISLLPLDKQKIIQNFIDMEISYMPMQSVGGDYYDFYKLDDKNILIFLGDASGHGVYAAMIWAILKVEVEELIEDNLFNNLSQAFTLLNQRITRILENTYSYATLFSLLINLENRTVSYISAGHPDQFYFSLQNQTLNKIRNKNPIIGIFRNAKFNADTIACGNGDIILMFSDGIVEGTNPDGELLGKEKLEEYFSEACKTDGNATIIIGDILLKLEDFFEGTIQKDDRTLMVIKL